MRAHVYFFAVLNLLTGCGGYSMHYFSQPALGGESTPNRNALLRVEAANFYVRPVNEYVHEEGAWIAGLRFAYPWHKPEFDETVYRPHMYVPRYFYIELLIDPLNKDVSVDASSIRLNVSMRTFSPDACIARPTTYHNRPDRAYARAKWSRGMLCSPILPHNKMATTDYLEGQASLIDHGKSIEVRKQEPQCLLVRFPISPPNPKDSYFSLELDGIRIDGAHVVLPTISYSPAQDKYYRANGSITKKREDVGRPQTPTSFAAVKTIEFFSKPTMKRSQP